MKINKAKAIARSMTRNYSNYDKIVNDLLEKKEEGSKKDVNSFIKSKNSISSNTEIQAIKNLNIDNKISEIKEWKKIIDYALEEAEKEYKYKGKALRYKFSNNMSSDMIADIMTLSPSVLKSWSNEFILEIVILAVNKKIINLDRL